MPLSHGVGHWPKSHFVQPPPQAQGPVYIQSYNPQWKPPNKELRQKPPDQPSNSRPGSPVSRPRSARNPSPERPPNQRPGSPSQAPRKQPPYQQQQSRQVTVREWNEQQPYQNSWKQETTDVYRSSNGGRPEPPRPFRARNYYSESGHNRLGINRTDPSTRTDFGHSRYGPQYDTNRTGIANRGAKPVGPRGLESFESYGPRMNMTSGACGSGMRPLWAVLGGLLALGGIAGIIAGGVLGAKAANTKPAKASPLGPLRYYVINGLYEPCIDRLKTTTTSTTTTTTTTTPRTTTAPKTTTHCIPLTIGTQTPTQAAAAATTAAAAANTATAAVGTQTATQSAVAATTVTAPLTTTQIPPTTSICLWVTYTTTVEQTTIPIVTTQPPLTTQTTLPYCDQLTTTYTLKTMAPIAVASTATRMMAGGSGGAAAAAWLLFLLVVYGLELKV